MKLNTKELKSKMIGLKGKLIDEKLKNYFSDMEQLCSEVSRVLKKGKCFIMIIGSNTNQTGGIRLEETVINSAMKFGLDLVKNILDFLNYIIWDPPPLHSKGGGLSAIYFGYRQKDAAPIPHAIYT